MENRIVSVSELNEYIKELINGSVFLSQVTVKAEISNFTHHTKSGHMYMTLKDEKCVVRAVMFAGNAAKLKFKPESGMGVIATGRVSVFERDGQYQLYINDMQPDGVGALQIAFEQLKTRLAAEGLFDQQRKKPIPAMPARVGVITSPTGAAVRDIINISARRFPLADIIVCPVLVQGTSAASSLANALDYFSAKKSVDVVIIGRGGGSLEELWAFNEELVARAVASCQLPVISAVGHETDFTICDFVADLRAPTPSAAAEIALPDRVEIIAVLKNYEAGFITALTHCVDKKRKMLDALTDSRIFKNPETMFDERKVMLSHIEKSAASAVAIKIANCRGLFSSLAAKLDALSPLSTLARGYSIASLGGKTVNDASQLKAGDDLYIKMARGAAECSVTKVLEEANG